MMSSSVSPRQAKEPLPAAVRAGAEIERRRRRASGVTPTGYEAYQSDPVGFARDVLGETLTPDVERMMESVRDYPVTIARSSNSTGKTYGAADLVAWFYTCFPPAQVYTAAAPPEDNLRNLLWGEIGALVARRPDLFAKDRITDLRISSGPRSFITGVTIPAAGTPAQRTARFSGKHGPYMLFVLDEADAIPAEVIEAIESCMSGGFVRLLLLFNPHAAAGTVYQMERDGRANVVELSAFNHPNVVTGEDRIPGAIDRETTVRRINEWSRPVVGSEDPTPDETFEVPAYLVGSVARSKAGIPYPPLPAGTRVVTDPALYYMTLGRYPALGSGQLISRADTAAARARWDLYVARYGETPPAGVKPVMGFDVADEGGDSNVVTFNYGGWIARQVAWGGVDADRSADDAATLYKARGCSGANVDGTGVGAGAAPKMSRAGCPAEKVMVASSPTWKTEQGEFFQLRDQMYWELKEWLRTDPSACLPPDEDLLEELHEPTYWIGRDGRLRVTDKATMRKALRRSPDRMESLALAVLKIELPRRGFHDL